MVYHMVVATLYSNYTMKYWPHIYAYWTQYYPVCFSERFAVVNLNIYNQYSGLQSIYKINIFDNIIF